MEEIYKVNDSNTKILKEHGLSDFVFSGLMEAISSSEFIANLVSTKRRTAAEMPKDKDGKIIVDLTNPHKLENMDYFRKAAIKFKNTGKYCDFREDNNPTSPWMKFWTEEKTRIKNGMIREDGEWIPGNLYQYWNYGMMVTNKEVDGISYQRENLPDPWLGNYLLSHYINQARHEKLFAELLKKRGAGWSFSIANEAINNSLFNKKFKTVFLATLSDYLFADDGTITKCWTMLNHLAEHTAFPRLKLTDRADEKVFGYIDEDGIKKGSQSSIAGLTLNDNYHKHRGRRGLTIFEEYGNFKNMDKAWTIAVSNVKMGKHTIAMLLCGGTGGVTGESFESANKMFYNPMSYSIKPIPNVYDKRNGDDIGECGMFWGNYLNLDGYSDKDGNPDVIGALIATYQDREHKKKNTVDKAEYIQSTAEHPIYPSEAMMRTAESIFPTVEVQEYLNDVTRNEAQFVAEHTAAKLFYTDDKKVWYKPDFHNEPCRKYPIIGENPPGCIELFYPPKKDETIPRGIYVIGVDPVDDDYNPRGSLASAIVFNIYTDTIVAELTGRSMFASDFFEDVLKLSLLYNADIMYEKNKKRFYEHFERKNQLDRLMDEPTFLTGMMPSMKKTMAIGNHRKGCYTSGPSKMIPMNLYNEYMREENKSTGKLNLYSIRSIGLLRETVNFSPISGNYDRISAMGMVMIARQAMKKDIENMETQGEKTLKSLYSDKGFQRLYGGYVTNRKSVQNQFGI